MLIRLFGCVLFSLFLGHLGGTFIYNFSTNRKDMDTYEPINLSS